MTSKLQFRLVSCSSEDPQYPISDLISSFGEWQSSRFCLFPQELIIQFLSPVIVKQIQFLSHQFKIASKIEIFTYLPHFNDEEEAGIKFHKMGFLKFDSNEKNRFSSRELKSVFMELPCLYMKMRMFENHSNKFNVFNQVGLCLLVIFGEMFIPSPTIQIKMKKSDIILSNIDETTLDRIKILEQAKEQAIQNEDFEKAKKLKIAIEKLKSASSFLLQLEKRKANAIANEDYDSAKVFSAEIAKIKNSVSPDSLVNISKIEGDATNENTMKNNSNMNRSEQEILNKLDFKDQNPDEKLDETLNQTLEKPTNLEDKFDINPSQPITKVSYDDQIIPAIAKTKKQNFEDSGLSLDKPEKLTGEQQKMAEPLHSLFSDEICEYLFSKVWQHRQEGLSKVIAQLNSDKNAGSNLPLYFSIITRTIKDKIAQVFLRSNDLLETILKNSAKLNKNDITLSLDNIIISLLEKTHDSNLRVKSSSEKSFIVLSNHPLIGLPYVLNVVIKTCDANKNNNSPKFLQARFALLSTLLKEISKNDKIQNEINVNHILEFIIRGLENNNVEIRKKALENSELAVNVFGEGKVGRIMEKWSPGFMDSLGEKGKKKS